MKMKAEIETNNTLPKSILCTIIDCYHIQKERNRKVSLYILILQSNLVMKMVFTLNNQYSLNFAKLFIEK